jgi:hypothetical protein
MSIHWPEFGPQLHAFARILVQNPDIFRFWLFDLPVSVLGQGNIITWPNRVCHPTPGWPLEPCIPDNLLRAIEIASVSYGAGSIEPTWDAIWDVATGARPVNWRPDSKRWVVLISDEGGQSQHHRNEESLAAALADLDPPINLIVVTEENAVDSFDDLPMGLGGIVDIEDDGIQSELVTRIVPTCL